jgi:hypothetical protein
MGFLKPLLVATVVGMALFQPYVMADDCAADIKGMCAIKLRSLLILKFLPAGIQPTNLVWYRHKNRNPSVL